LNRFCGFKAHHIEEIAQSIEAMAAYQPSEFSGQCSHIGCGLRAIAQGHLRDGEITDSAGLGSRHFAIPDEIRVALLSTVAIGKSAKLYVLV